MSASVHTSAPTHHHYTTLGLDSRKVAIWAFIGSECMLFVSLISTYLIYKGRSVVGPLPHEVWTDPSTGEVFKPILNIPVTSASTFVLLMSSLFMVLALAAVQNKELPKRTRGERILGNSKLWLFMTPSPVRCSSAFRRSSSPRSSMKGCRSEGTCSARRSSPSPASTA